jgi:hypothetical protein
MAVQGYNKDKCEQRNRIAGARFGVDAVPFHFKGTSGVALDDGFEVAYESGNMPSDTAAALRLINANLPEGADKLSADDVYLHILEAANSNFIGDRFMFLADSTLKNIGKTARSGIAFMNSHRTGGLSTPGEMPFGQTFAGSYQQGFTKSGAPAQRALVAVYMLRNHKPNGDAGPSTDDLHRSITAGSIKDVSVGLYGGERICDVCGNDVNDYEACEHLPGTHRSMSADEIKSQKQRDPRNKNGVATYSLHDATFSEVSAVYDGAVPGAGMRKVLNFSRQADASRDEVRAVLREAYEYYGALLPFDISELVELKPAPATREKENKMEKGILAKIAEKLGLDPETGEEKSPAPAPAPVPVAPAVDPETEALRTRLAQLEAAEAQRIKDAEEARKAHLAQRADAFSKSLAGKIPPARFKSEDNPYGLDAAALYTSAAEKGAEGELESLAAALPGHPMTERVPSPKLSVVKAPEGNADKPDAAGDFLARRNAEREAAAKTA